MMAAFLLLVQLLFIGTLIVPAHTQNEECNLLPKATASNATVQVTPAVYQAKTNYTVTISDNRTSTGDKAVTKYLLQALSSQNVSMGEWNVEKKDNCSSIETAVLTAPQKTANWTSPDSNVSSVEIRAYIILSDNSAELKTVTLSKEPERTTAVPSTTPNSVPMVQSSSFFIAVLQLPLFLFTSKLLS